MPCKNLQTILWVFLTIKTIQLVIVWFTPLQFDTSSNIVLANYTEDKIAFIIYLTKNRVPKLASKVIVEILDKYVVWDNVYFSDLFVNSIKFEHQYVFCPLWWRVIQWIDVEQSMNANFYAKLSIATIMSNLCHLGSSIILYYLTSITFKKSNFFTDEVLIKFSLRVSLLYILSPAGIFLSVSYSEAPCALLCFATLLLRELALNYHQFEVTSKVSIKNPILYILSGSCLAIAYGIRSNAALLGTVYINDLYKFSIVNRKFFKDSVLAFLTGGQLFFAIVVSNYLPYKVFCPERGEWCGRLIPSLFSYAQSHYWNVGFLRYWTINNIPNFIFALPTIILSLLACHFFVTKYPFINILPILTSQLLLVIGGCFFWHTQILNRISSFLPVMYWYLGSLEYLNTVPQEKKIYNSSIQYFIVWGFIQTAMFAAFLPPA